MDSHGNPAQKRIRIGDLLIQQGVISDGQLQLALDEQKTSGKKLGKVLVDLGFVAEDRLLNILSTQLNIPAVDLNNYPFDRDVTLRLPESVARRLNVVVLADEGNQYFVAMADPMDLFAMDELHGILHKKIRPAVAPEQAIQKTLDTLYRKTEQIASLASELADELSETDYDIGQLDIEDEVNDAPVVRLLQNIFEDAVQVQASDIHIEPGERQLRIRLRVDGVLQEQVMEQSRIASALVSRLKIMSGLDISERRLPQDGRFNIRVKNRVIDVRLSTMPVAAGEAVVMRLLDQSGGILALPELGMSEKLRQRLEVLVRRPHGMLLVTGPTGSGKTTTLYAALNLLNSPDKKIITAEDPVEYRLPRINQVQVNAKIGLTFARILRTALRQDPDIVLIGEMRDEETALIGMRAAMTGHFVLSTLHTNDAPSTATRLIDMGVAPFLVATSVNAILAQRLVRKVCEHCREEAMPTEEEKFWLNMLTRDENTSSRNFYQGAGCHHCNFTGYKGRVGVYELLELSHEMRDALRRQDQETFMQLAETDPHYQPLALGALALAEAGETSIGEVLRLTDTLDVMASQ